MTRFDAIVIGGGPAGSSVALRLSRAGAKVLLLERQRRAHHKVCGEFISAQAASDLAAFDFLPRLAAEKIEGCRLMYKDKVVEARLPEAGYSLSRFALDEELLTLARAEGATIRRGVSVRALRKTPSGWEIEGSDGSRTVAPAAFLATGKHDLRGRTRPGRDNYIGFKMHYRLSPEQAARLTGHVEIHMFGGGYAGLEPVENGHSNLCLVVRKQQYAARGKSWRGLIKSLQDDAPALGEMLREARPLWPRPLSIYGIPYGYVFAGDEESSAGLYRLGDQMAVTPSFSGSGMAIALHTAKRAAHHYLSGGSEAYYKQVRRELVPQVRRAHLVSRLPQKYAHWACGAFPERLIAAVSFNAVDNHPERPGHKKDRQ